MSRGFLVCRLDQGDLYFQNNLPHDVYNRDDRWTFNGEEVAITTGSSTVPTRDIKYLCDGIETGEIPAADQIFKRFREDYEQLLRTIDAPTFVQTARAEIARVVAKESLEEAEALLEKWDQPDPYPVVFNTGASYRETKYEGRTVASMPHDIVAIIERYNRDIDHLKNLIQQFGIQDGKERMQKSAQALYDRLKTSVQVVANGSAPYQATQLSLVEDFTIMTDHLRSFASDYRLDVNEEELDQIVLAAKHLEYGRLVKVADHYVAPEQIYCGTYDRHIARARAFAKDHSLDVNFGQLDKMDERGDRNYALFQRDKISEHSFAGNTEEVRSRLNWMKRFAPADLQYSKLEEELFIDTSLRMERSLLLREVDRAVANGDFVEVEKLGVKLRTATDQISDIDFDLTAFQERKKRAYANASRKAVEKAVFQSQMNFEPGVEHYLGIAKEYAEKAGLELETASILYVRLRLNPSQN